MRADACPDGLSKLPAELQARVKAANHLYDIAQKLCRECHHHGVLFSIENFARRFMWDTQAMKPLLADVPHFQVPSRQKVYFARSQCAYRRVSLWWLAPTRALGANIGRMGNFFGNRLEYPRVVYTCVNSSLRKLWRSHICVCRPRCLWVTCDVFTCCYLWGFIYHMLGNTHKHEHFYMIPIWVLLFVKFCSKKYVHSHQRCNFNLNCRFTPGTLKFWMPCSFNSVGKETTEDIADTCINMSANIHFMNFRE